MRRMNLTKIKDRKEKETDKRQIQYCLIWKRCANSDHENIAEAKERNCIHRKQPKRDAVKLQGWYNYAAVSRAQPMAGRDAIFLE